MWLDECFATGKLVSREQMQRGIFNNYQRQLVEQVEQRDGVCLDDSRDVSYISNLKFI